MASGAPGGDCQAGDAEESREIVEIRAGRGGQHDGAGGVVHPGAVEEGAVGHHLQQLHDRLALERQDAGEVRRIRDDPGLQPGEDGLEVQRLDDIRGGDLRQVDGGIAGHAVTSAVKVAAL
ncbi:hypothetical protein [Cereibacter changlensis]|uniref:hypothetical protein n=1 Tax=Cereibacter changlensis TaxID=402884 RepID=UPI0040331BF8